MMRTTLETLVCNEISASIKEEEDTDSEDSDIEGEVEDRPEMDQVKKCVHQQAGMRGTWVMIQARWALF